MIWIGWRNLRKQPLRMAAGVLGILFAVVMMTVPVGMLLALSRNASLLIDRSRADLWVSTVDVKNLEFATPVERRKRYLIESVPGVTRVEEFNTSYSMWKLPGGGKVNVQVVGYDLRGDLAPPLKLCQGQASSLHNQDSVIIDEGDRSKLGGAHLGSTHEILQHRARVVGFTEGMRSFTTTPYVFTSLRRADRYGWLSNSSNQAVSIFFLVKVAEGHDKEVVRRQIEASVSGVEAHTREGFSSRTRTYWLIETGVGVGFLVAGILGLFVGGVIVSQVLYAMTVEKLPEYGVLKALGFGMQDLARVVLEQSWICGGMGLILGLGVSYAIGLVSHSVGTTVEISPFLMVAVGVVTAGLCSSAALLSILRLKRLEPTMVFQA